MRLCRPQFTIRSLMIAVVVVAGLLALPNALGLMVIALSFPLLALVGHQWLVFRGQRRSRRLAFGSQLP